MYLLIVYNDINREIICAIIKFKFIKDAIKWSKGYISYNDIYSQTKPKRTYKRLFKILKLKSH